MQPVLERGSVTGILVRGILVRNFGPGNFGPGDQNFQWKIGPAGPIFPGKMVRLWKIGPNNGPSISALVTSDCCG